MDRFAAFITLAGVGFVAAGARAQTPDVSIVTDIRTSVSETDDRPRLRLTDPLGRHSLLTLRTVLENGIVAQVSQRFARIPNDRASSLLETAVIEAPGLWQLGQVALPFGQRNLIREYSTGATLQTLLLIDQLPLSIGWADGGETRVRGVTARLGGRVGISIATGDHFAATGSSLAQVRDPEQAPGLGRGYRTVLGIDASTTIGEVTVRAEGISLRRGHTVDDVREDYGDLSFSLGDLESLDWISVGYTHGFLRDTHSFRIDVSRSIHPKVAITGLAKWTDGKSNLAAGVRVRF